jgi:DNA polymerase eta
MPSLVNTAAVETTMPSDGCATTNTASASVPQQQRVILLLDLDCFYAQCECLRLGLDVTTTPLALFQWNSVLAVTYPARERFQIKRGDSWDVVREKSNGQCLGVHVPILTHGDSTEDTETGDNDMRDEDPGSSSSDRNKGTTAVPQSLEQDYTRIFLVTPEQQEAARQKDLGVRKFSSEGKACIERYRVASAQIFKTVREWIAETERELGLDKKQVVLERASIDEFFLDVTAACCDSRRNSIDDDIGIDSNARASATASFWSNLMDPALTKTVRIGGESTSASSSGENTSFIAPSTSSSPTSTDPDLRALHRGCALAYGIRLAVYDRIGFTLSAGVSSNKTLAKLSAAYGKPQGQALTVPSAVTFLLQDTKIDKCRNLGGKLGKKVQALLPTGVPATVGSIAKYLSLPDLRQGLQDASTALWVYQVARGIDSEKVAPKTEVALLKSITAFKSLPFLASGHSLTNAATLQWIQLLAHEVVTRVEQDAVRHGRYPRNCSVQYTMAANDGGKTTSIRTLFPAQRLSVPQRVADLVARVPVLIQAKLAGSSSSSTDKKTVPTTTIHRVGLCAIDFVMRQSNNAIDNYFTSTATSTATATSGAGEGGGVTSPVSDKVSRKEHPVDQSQSQHARATNADEVTTPAVDPDLELAKKLQASYHPSVDQPQSQHARATNAAEATPAVDPDLELAKKLQASYDREDRVLQVLEKKGGAMTQRPSKTRKISTFFTKR